VLATVGMLGFTVLLAFGMSRVPGVGHALMHLNPMATLVEAVRVIVTEGAVPPGEVLVAAPCGAFAVLALGVVVHRAFAPHVSDHV